VSKCDAMHFPIMAKRIRDQQIVVRIAAPLRTELEAAADDEARTLGDLVRRVLIDFAERRLAEREAA
jgi:hypothetical protein